MPACATAFFTRTPKKMKMGQVFWVLSASQHGCDIVRTSGMPLMNS